MPTRFAPVLLFLLAPLPAQELRWQLPPRGGAVYTRKLTVEQTHEPKSAWIPGVWQGEPQVAAVLAGELDAGRQCPAEPVADPREFLARIGLDLRPARGGKARLEVDAFDRFQPVRVDVVLGALGADGAQSIEANIEYDAKAARAASTNPNLAKLQGRLRGTRVLDAAKGLVLSVTGTAEFTVDYPAFQEGEEVRPVRKQQIRLADAWTLDAVLTSADAEFQERVTKAIRASIAALRTQLASRLERPFDAGGDPYHDHQPGELALALLALRRSGEDARDPLLQRGYDQLRRLLIHGTYELGVAILAMEALYTPPGEWAEMRAGRLKTPLPRTLPADDLAIVQGWAKELLDNIDTTVDAAYVRRWHYGPSKEWDNSTTQYALLGLYAATLCGVETSPQVWTAAANHWLQCGERVGTPDFVRVTTQLEMQKSARTRSGGTKLQAMGWGYKGNNATGSMTTAGIAALTLCSSALRIQKKGQCEAARRCRCRGARRLPVARAELQRAPQSGTAPRVGQPALLLPLRARTRL